MRNKGIEHEEVESLLQAFKPGQTTYNARIQIIHVSSLYLVIAGLCAFIWYTVTAATKDPSQLIYSPAMEAVEYEVVDFGRFFARRNEYMGLQGPNDETDALWRDLYKFGTTGIPKWQADLLDNKTERIPGTGTYLIELEVFHQLHCLDQIRMALYPDRYGQWEWKADGTVETRTIAFGHWEHCVDSLRQALMCHGDIHPLQHRINRINGILAPDLSTRHTCRNFKKLRDWAKEREAPEYEEHVAKGLNELKPDFTVQDEIETEIYREPNEYLQEKFQ